MEIIEEIIYVKASSKCSLKLWETFSGQLSCNISQFDHR